MSETVNFTGSVNRDLLRRAKVIAAKSETSVNALFNAELRYLVETFEAADTLDLPFKPGWSLALVDMVLHEATRSRIPTSQKLAGEAGFPCTGVRAPGYVDGAYGIG